MYFITQILYISIVPLKEAESIVDLRNEFTEMSIQEQGSKNPGKIMPRLEQYK